LEHDIQKKIEQELAPDLDGELLTTGHSDYKPHNLLWNGFFNPKPTSVIRCKTGKDVQKTIRFIRNNSIPFSVKSGGHDYAGKSVIDNGIVIDLSLMNEVHVDPDAKTAVAGPGVKWRQMDTETQKYGLATTGGTVSTVGISGFTLGGGTGYLARKIGTAADNLFSAKIVTATGQMVSVNENENPDLFWAIRGGSGNFGIVTEFGFRLTETGPGVTAGQIVHTYDTIPEALRFYRNFMEEASDDLTCYAFIMKIPAADDFPEKLHGQTGLFFIFCHLADEVSALNELNPLSGFGNPILSFIQRMNYTDVQQMFDGGMTSGNRWYSRANYFNRLSDELIDIIFKNTSSIPGEFSAAYLEPLGGAINRKAADAIAFPHRNAAFSFHIFPGWQSSEKDEEVIAWAREFSKKINPHAAQGVYVNLLAHDENNRIREAYGNNYRRLGEIKKKWDPENLFWSNHNIPPVNDE